MNVTSPKSAQLYKVMPCRYSPPVVQAFKSELVFNGEPTITYVGQNAVAFYTTSTNQLYFSKIQVDQNDCMQNSWQSSNQMNVAQLEMCVVEDTLLPVVRTLDGQVVVHAAGGL